MATYRIHPGIGIARLGNSDSEFYLAPETPAAMPLACDSFGNPLHGPDGVTPVPVKTFKDAQGRVKRQAARFQIFVYDDESLEGRPLALGDAVEGGGNHGVLVDIQWRVYVANKKASWYPFTELKGEHGYAPAARAATPTSPARTATSSSSIPARAA
nr:LodA/GoxA family CTQ-dependent oxidase [Bradyrhizobium liaoningense]